MPSHNYIDLSGRTYGRLTVIERTDPIGTDTAFMCACSCGNRKAIRSRHLIRGAVTSCGCQHAENLAARNWRGDNVTYIGAHLRVMAVRGKATAQVCVDCGSQAEEWSLKASPSKVKTEQRGRYMVPFSPEPSDYEPRCKRCHSLFDKRK